MSANNIDGLRSAKSWDDVIMNLEILMDDLDLWDLWHDQDTNVTLETVIQRIEEMYQTEVFRKKS